MKGKAPTWTCVTRREGYLDIVRRQSQSRQTLDTLNLMLLVSLPKINNGLRNQLSGATLVSWQRQEIVLPAQRGRHQASSARNCCYCQTRLPEHVVQSVSPYEVFRRNHDWRVRQDKGPYSQPLSKGIDALRNQLRATAFKCLAHICWQRPRKPRSGYARK